MVKFNSMMAALGGGGANLAQSGSQNAILAAGESGFISMKSVE